MVKFLKFLAFLFTKFAIKFVLKVALNIIAFLNYLFMKVNNIIK